MSLDSACWRSWPARRTRARCTTSATRTASYNPRLRRALRDPRRHPRDADRRGRVTSTTPSTSAMARSRPVTSRSRPPSNNEQVGGRRDRTRDDECVTIPCREPAATSRSVPCRVRPSPPPSSRRHGRRVRRCRRARAHRRSRGRGDRGRRRVPRRHPGPHLRHPRAVARRAATRSQADHDQRQHGLFNVSVVGKAGLQAFADGNGDCADDNVLAVAVNITVVDPDARPATSRRSARAQSQSPTAILNFVAGQTVANLAIVAPRLRRRALDPARRRARGVGRCHRRHVRLVLVERVRRLTGARLEPSGPGRIFDTRENAFESVPLAGGEQRQVDDPRRHHLRTGALVVPNIPTWSACSSTSPVSTPMPTVHPTFVSLLPAQAAGGPTTSNLNLRARPGALEPGDRADLSADGKICGLQQGRQHPRRSLDVVGYFVQRPDDTRVAVWSRSVPPFRVFDTREPESQPAAAARPTPRTGVSTTSSTT